jgi:hypothetical protein
LAAASDDEDEEPEPELVEETILAVSYDPQQQLSAVSTQKRQIVKFRDYISKQEVLILLDTGSVGTFIKTDLVHNCALKTQSCESMNFGKKST